MNCRASVLLVLKERHMPKITVLMAVYNAMPHLPAAVESIRAQTLSDWQMIVVNDGSTDGSVGYLTQLGEPRIRIIHQENRGLGLALNHGLAHCDTEFTARMDGDDLSHPTRLAEQLAFLETHPEVGLVGTQIERMGTRRIASNSDMAVDHERIDADLLLGRNQMYHPTIMFRTALAQQIGGYWPHPRGEEWDFFLRMAEVTRLANIDRVLLSYRVHTGSMTGSSVAGMRTWIDYACDCGVRRRAGQAPLTYEAFVARQRTAPLWQRASKWTEMHARNHYRIAVGEMLGDRPLVGSLRLAYSALWSPSLTAARCGRIAHHLARRVGLARPASLATSALLQPPAASPEA
jgi:glycosyltransferase involved in cell wall biosynthesis